MSHLLELVDEADRNKDGKIDFDEWETMGEFCSLISYLACPERARSGHC